MTMPNDQELMETESIRLTDEEQVRLKRLTHKKNESVFEIAFCGHFSAGKSSILNKLTGNDILPVSPIPTSANIIRIFKGSTGLCAHTPEGKEDLVYKGDIPWNRVREWGMQGEEITGLTITAPLGFLGNHGCIIDTPGVDSTDSSHESVTVDQLYTTDVIVYVMDYNHVQSGTNLHFLKQLSDEKKPVYIIINQIDKHDESEMSLEHYRKSVVDVLQDWSIVYSRLYMTSMKQESHPANEFHLFETHLKSLLYHSEPLIDISRRQLQAGFGEAVRIRIEEDRLEAVQSIYDDMKESGFSPADLSQQEVLETELDKLKHYSDYLWEDYQNELAGLYKNVTLFPYKTTELVREWLESKQKGFKAGFLFSKKKTQEEQKKRLDKLTESLQDNVKTQLLFHVQAYFQKTDRSRLTNQKAFDDAGGRLTVAITGELLEGYLKAGPVNRDYVYHFTASVTERIVKDIRSRAEELLELQIQGMGKAMKKQEEEAIEKLFTLQKLDPYKDKLEQVKAQYDNQQSEAREKLRTEDCQEELTLAMEAAEEKGLPDFEDDSSFTVTLPDDSVIGVEEEPEPDQNEEQTAEAADMDRAVKEWKERLLSFQSDSLLSTERNRLLQRINRYEDQTYMISLFGAFSAGKSSFANALLGAPVMPVSPHPTTASVNSVQRSDAGHPHGTAVVYFKTHHQLSAEIAAVADSLDVKLDIHSLSDWNPDKKMASTSWQKSSADYLLTLKRSLEKHAGQAGQVVDTTVDGIESYTAVEETASLVEKITMYYDCRLTESGIVLVDTPGVNSIHGRHTSTAFDQLRQSDAIFYVTYFNHAFSKADHYFLQQLSKVNDSFAEDKLYFVINAADLASGPGELNGVKKHVGDQLKRNGISQPRLYHVSSKQGLAAKLTGSEDSSGFYSFEQSFYNTTIRQLQTLGYKLIQDEKDQFILKINDLLTFIRDGKDVQKAKRDRLVEAAEMEHQRVKEVSFTSVERDAFHELDQFTLYLRQRMTYVMNDYFPEAVNVAVITGHDRRALRSQLTGALQEWRGKSEQFLNQELNAVLIRLENAVKRFSGTWLASEWEQSVKRLPHLSKPDDDSLHAGIQPEKARIKLSVDPSAYTSFIKSKKDFFENGQVKKLKEVLVENGTEETSRIINAWHEDLKQTLSAVLADQEDKLKAQLITSIRNESQRFDTLLDPEAEGRLQRELAALTDHLT